MDGRDGPVQSRPEPPKARRPSESEGFFANSDSAKVGIMSLWHSLLQISTHFKCTRRHHIMNAVNDLDSTQVFVASNQQFIQ